MVRVKPILRFQCRDQLLAHLIFVAANVGIMVILLIVTQFMAEDSFGSYTSVGLSAGIYMLATASVVMRSTFRLGGQMGVSRNSCFLSFVLYSILSAVALSVVIECVLTFFDVVTASTGRLHFSDLFAMLYLGELDAGVLSFGQHLLSVFFNLCIILFFTAIGAVLSMLFWRINRLGRTIIVILLIASPFWLSLLFFYSIVSNFPAFFFFIGQPRNVMAVLLLGAALLFCVGWLLIQKVHIRSGK